MVSATTRLHNFFSGIAHASPSSSGSSPSSAGQSPCPGSPLSPSGSSAEMAGPSSSQPFSPSRPRPATGSAATATFLPAASRPSLDEILTGQTAYPYSLPALVAYMSLNHCLETLEFTMDASRYSQHYERAMRKHQNPTSREARHDFDYVLGLWKLLVDTYVARNGRREVNLPSSVRDRILSTVKRDECGPLPPHPSTLSAAIRLTHDLITESVLVNFFHSAAALAQQHSAAIAPAQAAGDSSRMSTHSARSPTVSTGSQDREGIMTPPTTPPQCQLASLSAGVDRQSDDGFGPPVSPGSGPVCSVEMARVSSRGSNAGLSFSNPITPTGSTSTGPAKLEGAWRKMGRNLGLYR